MALNFLNDGYFAGKVGIGKPVPTKPLDVIGNAQVEGTLTVKTANNNIRLLDSNDGSVNFSVGVNGRFQIRDVNVSTTPFEIEKAALSNSLYIKADGNVGIGTNNPGGKLDVTYPGTGGSGTQGIGEGLNITSLTPNLTFNDTSTGVDNYAVHLNQNVFTIGRYTSATAQNPDLVLKSGNVGIGTTSPTAGLHVVGTGLFTGLVSGITPVAAANFVTKAYVDGSGGGTGPFLPLAGGTLTGDLTVDGARITIDTDTAGNSLTWKESDSSTTAGQLRGYGNRGDIYLYDSGVKKTELSSQADSFIPAIHIGGTTAATGGVLQTTGNVNIDGSADISATVTATTFLGDLNGTINTATTGTTQSAGNNSTLIATTAYADAAAAAVPIGNYLPLSAGSSYPLTGDLYVGGTTSPDTAGISIETTASSGGLSIISPTTGRGDIFFGDTTDTNIGQIRYAHTDNSMTFRTNASDKVIIAAGGNVGIGTTSPGFKLEVNGGTSNVIAKLTSTDASATLAFADNATTGEHVQIGAFGNDLVGYAGGSEKIRAIDFDGSTVSSNSFNSVNLRLVGQGKTGWGVGDVLGQLSFYNTDGSGIGARNAASIMAVCESGNGTSTTTFSSGLGFFVSLSNTAETEKMRLSDSGSLRLHGYDSTNKTGTPTYLLGTDGSGNVVKTLSTPGGDPGPYLPLAGNTTATAMTGDIFLANTQQVRFLTSTNSVGLRLQSSGTSSFIDNEFGDFYIRQEADNNDMIFQADDGLGSNATYFFLDGSEADGTGNLYTNFPDKSRLTFGDNPNGDLQIYHDGSNSLIQTTNSSAGDFYITAGGTNHDLYLSAADDIIIRPQGSENGIRIHGNDSVELYFNNSRRLRTTTGGVFVEGEIKIDSALLDNQENTDIDSAAAEMVAQVAIATYTAAFFDFVVKKSTNVRSGTVYACHDGTNVEFTETSTQDLGDTSDVVLSVDISGGNMRLIATVASDDWSVKSLIRAI